MPERMNIGLLDPHGLFIVKVTVPAYIFDMVPPAPKVPTSDTGIEEVIFDAQDFVYQKIIEIEAATQIHAKYQAYFYEFENGRLYMNIDLPPAPAQKVAGTGPLAGMEVTATTTTNDPDIPASVEPESESGFSEQSPDSSLEPFYLTFYKGPL
jgi:hypothetical protein